MQARYNFRTLVWPSSQCHVNPHVLHYQEGFQLVSVSRVLKIGILCLIAVPATVGAHIGFNQLTGNFHEVLPGELYRSGQPSGDDVQKYAQQFGIKTIINLRDENPDGWYSDEKNAADRNNVKMIDFPMGSARELPQAQAEELARRVAQALARSMP